MRICRGVSTAVGIAVVMAACAPGAATDQGAKSDYSKTPVIFIHGSGLSSRTWAPMMNDLASNGYPREYLLAIDLVPNNGSNIRAAEKFIAPAVERLVCEATELAQTHGHSKPIEKVDIVSHSMGAASSRWYAAKVAPERVRTWISIAGANHGTNALRGLPGAGTREMVPAFATSEEESSFQVNLNGTQAAPIDQTPFGVGADREGVDSSRPDATRRILYVTVRLEQDRWIKPEDSARLDGAGGAALPQLTGQPVIETSPGNFLYQGLADHDDLPREAQLISIVRAFLGARN